MSGLGNLLLYVSATIREHFLGLWFVGLALAAAWAGRARLPVGVAAPRVEPPRPGVRDYLAISAFLAILTVYLFVTFHRADLAGHDHSQLTEALLKQRSISYPIWPAAGRFWPLGLQEFNLLRYLAGTPQGYLAFATLELLVLMAALFLVLRDFSVAARMLVLGLVLVSPSVSTVFAGLIFPERNLLVLLAFLILAMRRFEERPSRWILFAVLALTHVALYYKEPVFALVICLAVARLALAWRDARASGEHSWRRILESHPLEVGMILLACLFIGLYLGTMLPHRSLGYATELQHGHTRAGALLWYLRLDPILVLFLVVFASRIVKMARGLARPDQLWDPLAAGMLMFFAVYVVLRLGSHYYLAPLDVVAILYLAERARVAVATGRLRTGVPIAVAALLGLLLTASTAFRTTRVKNMAWGKAALAQFVMQVADSASGPTRVFAPGLTAYALMEFGTFLNYKGAKVVGDSGSGGQAGVIILEGPHRFVGGKCVAFRAVPCTHVTTPGAGTLVLTFPEDESPGGQAVSLRPSGMPAVTYEPVLFHLALPWLRRIQQRATELEETKRTDWMWGYAVVQK